MDLIKAGYSVKMYNFGAPKTGDKAYANFCKDKFLNSYRVTHAADPAPHSFN